MSQEDYYIESKKIRMKYEILLFKDLLYLNYKYNKYFGENTNISLVFNELQNPVVYSNKEIKTIIKKCAEKLESEYNICINEKGDLI